MRSVIVILFLTALAQPAWAQDANQKSQPAIVHVRLADKTEQDKVDVFMARHNQADAKWQTKQCMSCHKEGMQAGSGSVGMAAPTESQNGLFFIHPQGLTCPQGVTHFYSQDTGELYFVDQVVRGGQSGLKEGSARPPVQWLFIEPSSVVEGLSYWPIDETMREHLKIPAGQGILISRVDVNSPSHTAGLAVNDIVLKVDEHPVGTREDFEKAFKAADGRNVAVAVLRRGSNQVLRLQPRLKVLLGPPVDETPDYPKCWIGVSVGPIEPALRSQLRLEGESKGLLVLSVVAGSPADKAGLKKGDLLLDIDGKPLDSPLTLRKLVESIGNRKVELHYGRDGELGKRLEITPEPYKKLKTEVKAGTVRNLAPQTEGTVHVEVVRGAVAADLDLQKDFQVVADNIKWRVFPATHGRNQVEVSDIRKRIEEIEVELRRIRELCQQLEQTTRTLAETQRKAVEKK